MDVLTPAIDRDATRAGWMLALVVLVGLLTLPAGTTAARAESAQGSEAIKAAYLYKFTNYVQWPDGAFAAADSPIVIGVAGDDDLVGVLERMTAGKMVNGRSFQVRSIDPGLPLSGVHVLYLGSLGRNDLQSVLGQVQGKPVLLVSESRRGCGSGCMINFVIVDSRLRFQVALQPAARSGLHFSALMLTAAYSVAREGP
jgi:hypothetical protein